MAPITSPSKVLVSGANGYIAAWVIKSILDRGHRVIGTVRSPSKGEYLLKQFGEKFSYIVVEDIAKVRYTSITMTGLRLSIIISQGRSTRPSSLV